MICCLCGVNVDLFHPQPSPPQPHHRRPRHSLLQIPHRLRVAGEVEHLAGLGKVCNRITGMLPPGGGQTGSYFSGLMTHVGDIKLFIPTPLLSHPFNSVIK